MKIQVQLIGVFEAVLLALAGAITIALFVTIFQPPNRTDGSQRSGTAVAEREVDTVKRA